jgi:hypothetical protein
VSEIQYHSLASGELRRQDNLSCARHPVSGEVKACANCYEASMTDRRWSWCATERVSLCVYPILIVVPRASSNALRRFCSSIGRTRRDTDSDAGLTLQRSHYVRSYVSQSQDARPYRNRPAHSGRRAGQSAASLGRPETVISKHPVPQLPDPARLRAWCGTRRQTLCQTLHRQMGLVLAGVACASVDPGACFAPAERRGTWQYQSPQACPLS